MYRYYNRSSPGEGASRACMNAGSKNAQCQSALQRELTVLEKERDRHLKDIEHDEKRFKQHLADRSPSPSSRNSSAVHERPRSADPRAASATHRSRKAAGVASPRGSPSRNGQSPPSRPGSSSLLPRRKSIDPAGNGSPESRRKQPVKLAEHVFVTEFGSKILRPVSAAVEHEGSPQRAPAPKGGACIAVPQIIVSDEADRGLKAGRGGSAQGSASDLGGSAEDPLPQSLHLHLPFQRSRSNSMPAVTTLPSIFKPPPRRPSYCPDPPSDLHVPESPRARSCSFSGIVPVRRRGSISEQWGSISERNRPVMGNLRGRRGSVDMGNMLRHLTYGVQHTELMEPQAGPTSVSDRQWEELKKCRYLRMPSRDNSEEDLSEGNGQ